MKSKSTSPKMNTNQKQNSNQSYDFHSYDGTNSFDFVGLYKTAAETSKILEKNKVNDATDNKKNYVTSEKRERSPLKNRKKRKQEIIELTQINIDASSLNSNTGARAQSNKTKNSKNPSLSNTVGAQNVRSIMKNNCSPEQVQDSPTNVSSGKPKKRNKSVSFMLEDNEEVVIKRTKSNDSIKNDQNVETKLNIKNKKKTFKKNQKSQQSEKENVNKQNMEVTSPPLLTQAKKPNLKAEAAVEPTSSLSRDSEMQTQEKRKKFKRVKKQKAEIVSQYIEDKSNNVPAPEVKLKKNKNKKSKVTAIENEKEIGEPHSKSRKIDPKPDIVEDLENLSIGDNAHTLTSLLDDMTVVDKDKKKKLRQKSKKKKDKLPNQEKNESGEDGNEKEKIKWNRRKWNKDKKGDLNDDTLTTVVVENLPLKIMLNYKKMLTDHFVKYGLIKNIGLAEVYPTEDSKPVFTTTVHFYSDGAAQQALELNNTEFEGSRIRVKHPLPKTETTIVVRSYGELTDQNISSTFFSVGKIRSIRHLLKGKKSMATAFVEFASSEAVKLALTKTDVKIGGKKVHVAKFEPRFKKKKVIKAKNDGDSAADADSEHSND